MPVPADDRHLLSLVVMQIAVQTMTNAADTLALSKWAEEAGLAAFAVADHYLRGADDAYALDQLTLLGAVAATTRQIELATLVSPVTFRHPAVMLKAAVTLAELSGGRFTLGVGTGWMDEEHELFGFEYPGLSERFEMTEEALGYLRAAMEGGDGYAGARYRLAAGTAPLPTGPNLRIVVGGGGLKKTPRLAGTYGDEFNASLSGGHLSERIERARQAAESVGRDPSALLISTATPLLIGEPNAVDSTIEALATRTGRSPEEMRERIAGVGYPHGTVDDALTHLEALESHGVERIYFQVASNPLEEVMSVLGELV